MKTLQLRLFIILGIALIGFLTRVQASSPTSHIIIADETIKQLLANPKTDPALKRILSDPAAREAFRGGACAPDLATISDAAHCDDPKATAEKLMKTATDNLTKANARLNAATTAAERAQAEKDVASAQADLAFAYGWRCHAAADFETHPIVNSSLDNYWEESSLAMKAWHGEWETMQEENWREQYGQPSNLNVDYRPSLLNQSFGLTREQVDGDASTLNMKITAADAVGTKYDNEQRDFWGPINQGVGERSITRSVKMVNNPGSLDNSCWDIAPGIPQIEFIQFEEETEKKNDGKLPDNFWVGYEELFAKWKKEKQSEDPGTGTGLPPPAPPSSSNTGKGKFSGMNQY